MQNEEVYLFNTIVVLDPGTFIVPSSWGYMRYISNVFQQITNARWNTYARWHNQVLFSRVHLGELFALCPGWETVWYGESRGEGPATEFSVLNFWDVPAHILFPTPRCPLFTKEFMMHLFPSQAPFHPPTPKRSKTSCLKTRLRIDLMESSIAQSIHRGFEQETWQPVK